MKLIIVDDQRILAEGLKLLLSNEEDIEVVAIGENGLEAVELARSHKPDVMLIDIQMPLMNGVEAIKVISKENPQVKLVILTTFMDDDYIYEGLASGAVGYLLKDASPSEIARALRVVYAGGALIEPQVAAKMLSQFSKLSHESVTERLTEGDFLQEQALMRTLTARELEIVRLIAEGLSNQEIGEVLFITEGTVKNNLTKILQKLDLRDRTQLAIHYLKGQKEGV